MKLRTAIRITALSMAVLLTACGHDDGRIPEKDLIPLLADLHIGEAYAQNPDGVYGYSRDSIGVAILEARGYTVAQLDTTIGWYGRNLDDYAKLYVKVDAELDRRMKEISGRDGGTAVDADLQDLWPYNRFLRLNPADISRGFSFSLPVADLTPGAVLDWKMRNVESIQLDMLLGVEYSDGQSRFLTGSVHGNVANGVTLQTDTGLTVRRVFGLLRPSSSRFDRPIMLDSISLQVSPIDSTNLYRARHQKKYELRPRLKKTESPKASADTASVSKPDVSNSQNTQKTPKSPDLQTPPRPGMPPKPGSPQLKTRQ